MLFRSLDTARSYNDWIPGERGRSEGVIGRWLQDRRCRRRIVLATKGGHAADDGTPRLTAAHLAGDIDASLRRLAVDEIDLYYLHRDDPSTPVESIIDALNEHVRAGKVRHLGCSNWRTARVRAANAYAETSGQSGFIANQPMWNAAVIAPAQAPDQTLVVMDRAMRDWHTETGLACVPFSAQAGGLFSKLDTWTGALRLRVSGWPAGYPAAPNRARAKALSAIAMRRGAAIEAVVLAYLTSQPFVTVPIVGCRTVDQLESTLAGIDLRLDADELAAIDQATA